MTGVQTCALPIFNTEDKKGEFLHCPVCGAESKNIRIFDVDIKGIGEKWLKKDSFGILKK